VNNTWKQEALELAQTGLSWRKIAKQLGVARSTVSDWLRTQFKHSVKRSVSDSETFSPVVGAKVLVPPKDGPKVLVFDLECSAELSYHFGRYKVNIPEAFNVRPSYLLSFSAKWLGQDDIVTIGLPYYDDYHPDKHCDKRLCEDLHKLLSEADILVAHNLVNFDWKVAQTRFLLNGLDVIPPNKLVDTLNIAKQNFRFPTNKLETLAKHLGVGEKMQHSGASLWVDCVAGKQEAWLEMLEYNTIDVEVLEKVYLKLRPYDKKHPNVSMYFTDRTERRCVCCGSTDLSLTDKKSFTGLSQFAVYQCNSCGKHSRSRLNTLTKEERGSLLMNVQ
jgi:transposase-like protein